MPTRAGTAPPARWRSRRPTTSSRATVARGSRVPAAVSGVGRVPTPRASSLTIVVHPHLGANHAWELPRVRADVSQSTRPGLMDSGESGTGAQRQSIPDATGPQPLYIEVGHHADLLIDSGEQRMLAQCMLFPVSVVHPAPERQSRLHVPRGTEQRSSSRRLA